MKHNQNAAGKSNHADVVSALEKEPLPRNDRDPGAGSIFKDHSAILLEKLYFGNTPHCLAGGGFDVMH